MDKFKGTGVALVTPFQENGSVDYSGLQKLVEFNIDNGIDFLVVQGTTGESVTLTEEEKRTVLDFVIEINAGRLPIVLGMGGNNTQALVEQLKSYDLQGVDALLSVSPYYNKPTQEGIYQHYKMIAENSPLPIILYNVPGRTGSNVSSETTLRLAHDFKNIIAVKEASGDLEQAMEIIQNRPKGFLVLSGDDNLTLPMIAAGGEGVISVVAQGFPQEFTNMVNAALNSDFETARDNHYRVFEITKYLFVDGNPGGIKEVLKNLNICGSKMRLPLVPVGENTRKKLYQLMAYLEETA